MSILENDHPSELNSCSKELKECTTKNIDYIIELENENQKLKTELEFNKSLAREYVEVLAGTKSIKDMRKELHFKSVIEESLIKSMLEPDEYNEYYFTLFKVDDIEIKEFILAKVKLDVEEYIENSDLLNMFLFKDQRLRHHLLHYKHPEMFTRLEEPV